MTENELVGTWRLISWENRRDGHVRYPFGRNATGYITYTPDGYMSVALMAADRTAFATGDLLSASNEERIQAQKTYLSYCGRYEIQGDRVVHHVELSLFPNWVGDAQVRFVELSGNRLTLSTAPALLEGSEQRAYLTWERASLPE